jgi:hypothetical protein
VLAVPVEFVSVAVVLVVTWLFVWSAMPEEVVCVAADVSPDWVVVV